jgi:hypothetical protein
MWSSLFRPSKLCVLINTTGRLSHLRKAWVLLAFCISLVLSIVFVHPLWSPITLLLPLIAVFTVLVVSLGLKDPSTDALGAMLFGFLPVALLAAAGHSWETVKPMSGNWQNTFVFLIGIPLFFGALWKLMRSGLNRGFISWPFGIAMFCAALALLPGAGFSQRVSRFGNIEAVLIIILCTYLLAAKLCSPVIVIQSFIRLYATPYFSGHAVAEFKRQLSLFYAATGVCLWLVVWRYPSFALLKLGGLVFFIFAFLEMELPLYFYAWLRLRMETSRLAAGEKVISAGQSVLFRFPYIPLEIAGIDRYLTTLSEAAGPREAAVVAMHVLFDTSYHQAPHKFLQLMQLEEPSLVYEVQSQINEVVEKLKTTHREINSGTVSARPSGPAWMPPISPSTAYSAPAANRFLRGAIFSHWYSAPRGREGSPLAAMPLWFPVAEHPEENMSLEQVIYRCLSSTREPFRKATIVLQSADQVSQMTDAVSNWASELALESFGASLIPIHVSLSSLLQKSADLAELATRVEKQRKAMAVQERDNAYDATLPCKEFLRLATGRSGRLIEQMTDALRYGNAWIIVEDDCSSSPDSTDMKVIRKNCDLVFGNTGFSHVPVMLITYHSGVGILSDSQIFRLRPKADSVQRLAKKPGQFPRGALAAICRITSWLGTPPMQASLYAAGAIGLTIAAAVTIKYEVALKIMDSFPSGGGHLPRNIAWLPIALLVGFEAVPFVLAYVYGLFYGSEEVRQSCVEVLFASIPMFLLSLLVFIPKRLPHSSWKSLAVFTLSAPGSFFLAMTFLGLVATVANVIWLVLSNRILRHCNENKLQTLCGRYNVVLHVAKGGLTLPLASGMARPLLPLLLSVRTVGVIPLTLSLFPRLIGKVKNMTMDCLDKGGSSAAASLLLSGLTFDIENAACSQCSKLIADDCRAEWENRDEFGEYLQPSTSFKMNLLEYTARKLCYLTNLEEIVTVR